MSILFALLVGLFLHFLPLMMTLWYRSNGIIILIVLIINLFAVPTVGIAWFIAFIIAAFSIKFTEIIKSLLFALLLIVLCFVFFAAELAAVMGMVGLTVV